ncbi:MAG: hypothetical protein ACYSTS_07585 [Planctomycetota bacterium]|jgi:IS30 family transposase
MLAVVQGYLTNLSIEREEHIEKSNQVYIDDKIRKQFSPDQISGKLRKSGIQISHERIYQYLLDDNRNGGQLYKNLRHSHRKCKKRHGSREKRGQIPKECLLTNVLR